MEKILSMKKVPRVLKFCIIVGLISILISLEIKQPIIVKKKEEVSIPVEVERLKKDVKSLCEIEGYRNYVNLEGLNNSANYIFKAFSKEGIQAKFQSYFVEGNEYKNVITYYGDTNKKQLIIGAHYDVCHEQPGADDNASGIAGLLELDRLLDSLKPTLDYGIQLVAYTLEEPPYFRTNKMGSYVHAKSLKSTGVDVLGMICLEMIGYYSEEKKSQDYPVKALKILYPNKGNYIAVVSDFSSKRFLRKVKRKMKEVGEVPVESITAPAIVPGIDFSDHQNYWKFDYPAVMVTNTAFYRNKNYHKETDTPETLDYDKMKEVVKSIYWSVTNLEIN